MIESEDENNVDFFLALKYTENCVSPLEEHSTREELESRD